MSLKRYLRMNKRSKNNIPLSTRKRCAPLLQTPEFKKKLKRFEFDMPGNDGETLNKDVVSDEENKNKRMMNLE